MFKQYQWKIVLSLFIIYHCFIVFLYPNSLSYLKTFIQPYTVMYANLLGLNRPWPFFSIPGPSVYLKSYIFKEEKEIAQYLFPHKKDDYIFRPMFNRRYAIARFLAFGKGDSVENIFIPYVCSMYPEATTVSVYLNFIKTPPITEVEAGTQINKMKESVDHHLIEKKCVTANSVKDSINSNDEDI